MYPQTDTNLDECERETRGGGHKEDKVCGHPGGDASLQVRLGEKEALEATLQFFESRAKRLGDLEYYQ